jgi:predicted transcriptional regulator
MDELARLSSRNDDGMTMHELCAQMGRAEKAVRRRLYMAQELGWLVVGARTITNLAGARTQVPVYRVVRPVVPLQKAGGHAGHTPRNRR